MTPFGATMRTRMCPVSLRNKLPPALLGDAPARRREQQALVACSSSTTSCEALTRAAPAEAEGERYAA
jgi:hypothetical protein